MVKNKNLGFTLVELLISISIIALLTVVASISYSKAQKSSRDQKRIGDLKAIQEAAEQYYLLNNGAYPDGNNFYRSNTSWSVDGQNVLQAFPSDPKGDGYENGGEYFCNVFTDSAYCVCAYMEDTDNGNSSGWSDCSSLNNSGGQYYCVRSQQ